MHPYTKPICEIGGMTTLIVSSLDYLPQIVTVVGGLFSIVYFWLQIHQMLKDRNKH